MSMVQQPFATDPEAPFRGQRVIRFLTDHGLTRQVVMDVGIVVEMALVTLSAVIAKVLYIDVFLAEPKTGTWGYLGAGIIGACVTAVALHRQRLYDADRFAVEAGHVRRLLLALIAAFLVLGAIGYMVKVSADYSRGWALTWFAVAFILLLVERKISVRVLGRMLENGPFARRVVVIGTGKQLEILLKRFREGTGGVSVAGVYHYAANDDGVWQADNLDVLISQSRQERVDEIVLALPLSAQDGIAAAITRLSQLPVHISVFGGDFAGLSSPRGLRHLGSVPLLLLQARPLDDWGRIAKSIFDRCGSAALLMLFAPLFACIAFAIKIDSPGPVFFCQRRHGLNHRVITVWKFRSMRVAEDGPVVTQATSSDPRVTRLGGFLRRTSLDELPQLWNVLRGEMSLVGPRPHAIVHNEYYGAMIEAYANRHKVKPGMTGWAQIHGYRGNTEDPELMRKRVEHDLYYIERWSLPLDIEVLAKTAFKGFVNARAY